jgi:hypothetical protein
LGVGKGGWLDGRAVQKVAGVVVGFQKRLHARAHLAVGTRCIQESLPPGGIFLDGQKKDLFHAESL